MKTITLTTATSKEAGARTLNVELNVPETIDELVSRMGDTQTAIDFFTRGLKISAQSIVRTKMKKEVTDKVILSEWDANFIPPTRTAADPAAKAKNLVGKLEENGMTKEEILAALGLDD